MNKKQDGFGFAFIVILVVIITTLGLVAWRLSLTGSTTQTDLAPQEGQAQTLLYQEPPSLSIKEWGVKIRLSSATAGAYYMVDPNAPQTSTYPEHFVVYSKDVDALVGSNGVSCKGEYIAYIKRLPKDDPAWQPSQTIDDGRVSTLFRNRIDIAGFRYAVSTYRGYAAACFGASANTNSNDATAQKLHDIAQTFAEDFKSIRAE